MGNQVKRIFTIPAETIIGQGVNGTFRGWLDRCGELIIKSPFELDTLTAFRVMVAFDRLAHDNGISVMGCEFISPLKRQRPTNC